MSFWAPKPNLIFFEFWNPFILFLLSSQLKKSKTDKSFSLLCDLVMQLNNEEIKELLGQFGWKFTRVYFDLFKKKLLISN